MMNAKLNLLAPAWNDLIFNGRNKAYGAYVIRMKANGDLSKALCIGIGLFLLAVFVPVYLHKLMTDRDGDSTSLKDETVMLDVYHLPKKEDVILTVPVSQAKSHKDIVKMKSPKIVPHQQVTEEPPSVNVLKNADPGPANLVGDPGADIAIGLKLGEQITDGNITEGNTDENKLFIGVEVPPSFPGGMKAFSEYVVKNYHYPQQATEQAMSGKILLTFVVEKDGSLTDVKVVRDLGYGTGEEAIRLLANSPKWKPGIQNGRPVRVRYQLPIQLHLN